MKDKVLLSYHKNLKVSKHVQPVFFGNVKAENYDPETNTEFVKPLQTVDEFTFYFLYCTINNITEKEQIASTQLLVLSAIMCKPLDFSLPIDSKDGKLTKIAEELSTSSKKARTPNSIYQSVKRLRDKGYLVETEDRLIVPNAKFQYVRQVVKKQLQQKGLATFDYIFKCFISNPKNNVEEKVSSDSFPKTDGQLPGSVPSNEVEGY
jgi:hypothetical protein